MFARLKRWLAGVRVVALDLTDTYRAGLSPHLSHARHVADPFHVTRVGSRTVDLVRRRVQNEQLGHRGRKTDPLFKIRKLLLKGPNHQSERRSTAGRTAVSVIYIVNYCNLRSERARSEVKSSDSAPTLIDASPRVPVGFIDDPGCPSHDAERADAVHNSPYGQSGPAHVAGLRAYDPLDGHSPSALAIRDTLLPCHVRGTRLGNGECSD